MKTDTSKIFAQFAAGIFGGTILGIAGFLIMMNYAGNYGCWAFIDSLFGVAGYESCGSFGLIVGLIIGSLSGIAVLSKVKILKYSKVSVYLLLGAFILPLLFGGIMLSPLSGNGDFLMVLSAMLGFMGASILPSAVITGAIHWRTIFRKNS